MQEASEKSGSAFPVPLWTSLILFHESEDNKTLTFMDKIASCPMCQTLEISFSNCRSENPSFRSRVNLFYFMGRLQQWSGLNQRGLCSPLYCKMFRLTKPLNFVTGPLPLQCVSCLDGRAVPSWSASSTQRLSTRQRLWAFEKRNFSPYNSTCETLRARPSIS